MAAQDIKCPDRNTRRGAVDATLETLLGKRRSHDVVAQSLEHFEFVRVYGSLQGNSKLGAVVPVNALPGVDADAERFGDRLLFAVAP